MASLELSRAACYASDRQGKRPSSARRDSADSFLFLLYVVNLIDRNNIGIAKLADGG
ncbi:MAG: hypothetical protein U0744_21810 [Gemmataceae bacterium]